MGSSWGTIGNDIEINYEIKDITTVQRGIIVHGVNCQGRMGSGVALAIRNKWPEAYNRYMMLCRNTTKKENLLHTSQFVIVDEDLYVGNLFTQVFYGYDGKKYADLQAVKRTLEDAFKFAKGLQLPLYMPKIACTRGGLNWEFDVEATVKHYVNKYPDVYLTVCDV